MTQRAEFLPGWRLLALLAIVATAVVLFAPRSVEQFGYVPNPDGVQDFLAELEQPLFRDAGAEAIREAKGEDTFLYRPLYAAHRAAYGREFVVGKQGIGDCTGWAYMHGIWISHAVDWDLGRIPQPPLMPSSEAIYGGSRCQARGKDFAGFSDGSYGAACARWCKDWGIVYRKPDVCGFDLTQYSAARAKDWGAYGAGGQQKRGCIDLAAKAHPVRHVALIRNWRECAAALESGFSVVVCSMYGFSSRRDDHGYAVPDGKRSGTWAHAMCLCAVRYQKNGSPRDAALCLNSWGPSWNGGPKWPADQPDGSFWIEASTVEGMLSAGDSFAVGSIDGFPFRDLHHGGWVQPPPRPETVANDNRP